MSTTNQPLDQLKNHLKEKGLLIPLIIAVVALVAGLLIGTILGGASAESSAKSAPAAKPVPAVTVTATPAAQVVEQKSVPKECTDALDEADHGFDLASDMSDEFRDAITAIQAGDIDGIKSATKNIKSINSSLGNLAPQYNADKLVCRAAAE
jgi:hypothetical protein